MTANPSGDFRPAPPSRHLPARPGTEVQVGIHIELKPALKLT